MSRPDRKRVVIPASPVKPGRRARLYGQPARSREGWTALSVVGAAALATFVALFLTSRPYDPMNSTFDAQQTAPSSSRLLQSSPTPTPTSATATPSPAVEPTVETAPVDDSTIQTQIERAARSDPALANLDVSTIVEGGRVTIVGSVPSIELKQRVERTIRAIRGVVAVDNQLVVIEATPEIEVRSPTSNVQCLVDDGCRAATMLDFRTWTLDIGLWTLDFSPIVQPLLR